MPLKRETRKIVNQSKSEVKSKRKKQIPLGERHPTNTQIETSKKIFEELKRNNPKSVLNPSIVAEKLVKDGNIPYSIAYNIATKMSLFERMKK